MSKTSGVTLTVVSIGRNESRNLPKHIESLIALKESNLSTEFIYVDSDSTDDSVSQAKSFFNKVIVIAEAKGHLSASLGRHVGTVTASGEWILYLDGDFELYPDFVEYLSKNLEKLAKDQGISGFYNYIYSDGLVVENALNFDLSRRVKIDAFGGGVLLNRAAVLEAGNWSANLYANEEIDLKVRLEKKGYDVYSVPVNFIKHHTLSYSNWTKVKGNLFPTGSYLGKKFYGPGQALVQAYSKDMFWYFFYRRREIYLTGLLQLICLILSFSNPLWCLGFIVPILVMAPKHGPNRSIAFSLHFFQILFGLFKFVEEKKINVQIKESFSK